MADVFAESFGVLNYSGLLFNKGNSKTPLSSIIGSKMKETNHVEFVTGQEFNVGGGAQPAISEDDSLTAPDASVVTRLQKTNVTQIFHEALGISYAKQSNMGTLSGLNVENQVANPMNELDFQVSARMQKIANDIEYTFINGVYQKASDDTTPNKTRGLVTAITSNVYDATASGADFDIWDITEALKKIADANAPTEGLALWCDATTMIMINKAAARNNLTIVPDSREVNGIRLSSLVTPLGVLYLYLGQYMPEKTSLLLNMYVIAPVMQPVPGKGNFFLEELARTGAGAKYQIFGQVGLDHGPEWYHGKITNIGGRTTTTG